MKFQYVSHLNKDKIILCRESTADRQEYQVHEKTTNDNQITRTEKNTKKREQENYTIIQLKMKVHSKYMRPCLSADDRADLPDSRMWFVCGDSNSGDGCS